MEPERRKFFRTLAALSAGSAFLPSASGAESTSPAPVSDEWDLSWRDRVTGEFRAVFDSPGVNDGVGLWRAADWKRTVRAVYGDAAKDASAVLVIRHEAIPMIMNGAFWERHDLSKARKIKDPATSKHVPYNPFVSKPDASGNTRSFTLDGFLADGGIILACNYAFGFMVGMEAKKQKVKASEARSAALEYLIPGVILQPSGFFAVIEAQRAGCHFFPASG
jgi:hypothetical protein